LQIQWYPGHMAKGKKLLLEQLKLVDIVIEVLDARIPISSANPDVHKLIGNKPRVVILNKEDLADPGCTKEWISWFKNRGIIAQGFDSTAHKGAVNLVKTVVNVSKSKMTRKKFLLPRATRAIVVGIPNVGKSTLINTLVRKKTAKTGNKPGVTKGKQWVRILSDLELLDTPGLLWPKFESLDVGFHLAVTGAIKDQVFDLVEVAIWLLNKLKTDYPNILSQKYKFFTLDQSSAELLELFGQKRGFLQAGGSTDLEKSALALLHDFRNGKLGRITLEKPLN
jgi:ribosome biogenesis GTPase A